MRFLGKISVFTIPIVFIGFLLLGLGGCVYFSNRFHEPAKLEIVDFSPRVTRTLNTERGLAVATWNIGYAGMGKEADFIMDMGRQKRPTTSKLVDRNIKAITKQIQALEADILLLQEAARPSWNTYGRDVLGALQLKLSDYDLVFGADINTRYVPQPFNFEIGNAIFTRLAATSAERRALPLEPKFRFGMFRKGYRMHILRINGEQNWVFINIHLSAFDDKISRVREKQLKAVIKFSQAEYAMGHHVVIGGDWNLRLAPSEFEHSTEERYLFWIRDLPPQITPQGWQWAIDAMNPTVRTAHKPYQEKENFRLIVDGFLVSPNVNIESINTLDLQFEYSDHNPVIVRLSDRVNKR